MSLLRAGPAHAEALAAIHATGFAVDSCWGAAAFVTLLRMPGTRCLLHPHGGLVMARVAADEAEILTLAVLPASRRQGLATLLLRAAMRDCGAGGAATMVLEVATDNAAALALYHAEGFAAVGQRPRYYPGGTDALLLRRALAEAGGAAGDHNAGAESSP